MSLEPRVVQTHVIGDEIEHQPQAARPKPITKATKGRIPAQGLIHGVAGDREPGSRDVLFLEIRESFLEFPPPFRVAA
jgi:hypothetical protein